MNRNRHVGMEALGRDPDSEDVSVEKEIFGTKQEMAPKNRKKKNTERRRLLSSPTLLPTIMREYWRSLP